jgi:glycosyltransferase involved in cell wall biosynthesis
MAARLPALRPDRYRVVVPPRALAHRAGHAWEQAWLPALAAGSGLLYSPANLAPVAFSRNAVVIHDVAALRHPEAYTRAYVAYQRRILPKLARRARVLITVSEFARQEIVELLHVAPERITVIPEGVAEHFFDATPDPQLASRYGLTKPYVLTVGTVSERKNLASLEQASRDRDFELVLAGSDRGYLRGASGPVRRLGYVPEEDLPGLYAGAVALAMPSRYEGFGLPCLEAMAAGTPVVAAARGALPETVGEAGLLVNPDRPGELAGALSELVSDASLRAKLVDAGRRRAARFSWDTTAARTDAVIAESLAASSYRRSDRP